MVGASCPGRVSRAGDRSAAARAATRARSGPPAAVQPATIVFPVADFSTSAGILRSERPSEGTGTTPDV